MIPIDHLFKIFRYEAAEGALYWLPRIPTCPADYAWNARVPGRKAGRPHRHGHLYANIAYPKGNPKNYAVHRLIWAMHYGEWPSGAIDHINGIPDDNRVSNLRIANHSQNMMNTRLRRDNTSGYKGVAWCKKASKWQVYITYDGKTRSLGRFSSLQEAIAVRRRAAAIHFGRFARESDDRGHEVNSLPVEGETKDG